MHEEKINVQYMKKSHNLNFWVEHKGDVIIAIFSILFKQQFIFNKLSLTHLMTSP